MKTVAIIGGGITGLTAGFRLQQSGMAVTVYEGGPRAGGVIQSIECDGYLAECGPNTLLETSPKITALISDLGLDARKMYSDPAAENRYLVRNGQPVSLPTSPVKFIRTPLFSTSAKFRLLAEPFVGTAPAEAEESVAEFVLRRLGPDFLNYAINPLVGGIYAGDPAKLSVKHAFPKLHALEQRYHSLLAGQVLGARARRRRGEASKQNAKKISFDRGLQTLTDELHARLGSSVRLKSRVEYARQMNGSWLVCARENQEEFRREYDAVLFCGTAHALSKLLVGADHAPNLGSLSQVYYPPVASVVLGFRREDVQHPLDGFGMLIPEIEKFNCLGTLFSSSLFPNRAPAGHVLLTSYLGGARNPKLAWYEPEDMIELVLGDLRKLLGVTGRPTFSHCFVYPEAIPQYEVGYGRFKELMSLLETNCPGFFLAGHYRDGVSLGDSIVSAHTAAERIQSHLTEPTHVSHPANSQFKAAA